MHIIVYISYNCITYRKYIQVGHMLLYNVHDIHNDYVIIIITRALLNKADKYDKG